MVLWANTVHRPREGSFLSVEPTGQSTLQPQRGDCRWFSSWALTHLTSWFCHSALGLTFLPAPVFWVRLWGTCSLRESPHLEAICFYKMFTIPAPDIITGVITDGIQREEGFRGLTCGNVFVWGGRDRKQMHICHEHYFTYSEILAFSSHPIIWVLKRSSHRQYSVSLIKIKIAFFFFLLLWVVLQL